MTVYIGRLLICPALCLVIVVKYTLCDIKNSGKRRLLIRLQNAYVLRPGGYLPYLRPICASKRPVAAWMCIYICLCFLCVLRDSVASRHF